MYLLKGNILQNLITTIYTYYNVEMKKKGWNYYRVRTYRSTDGAGFREIIYQKDPYTAMILWPDKSNNIPHMYDIVLQLTADIFYLNYDKD